MAFLFEIGTFPNVYLFMIFTLIVLLSSNSNAIQYNQKTSIIKKAGELSFNDFHRTEEEAAHRLGQNIQ